MIKNLTTLLLLVFLASCVPTKNLIYLQGEPVTNTEIQRINNTPYKLQIGDILTIDLKSANQDLVSMFQKSGNQNPGNQNNNSGQSFSNGGGFFSGYTIDNHGNIRLPHIGKINVLGYTTVEVRKKLDVELAKHFKNKNDIFITVKLSGIKYTVIGEVGTPGPQIIYQNNLNIIDAITNAGDISVVGNRKKVEIIRSSITGKKKYYIDLTKVTAFNSDVFYIKPNDIINVYPLPQKSWGVGTTGFQALSTAVSVISLVTSLIIIAKNI